MHRFFGSCVKIVAVSVSALAAMSCGAADNDPGPGGVTVGEARALDDAADMLDTRNADPGNTHGEAEAGEAKAAEPDAQPAQ